MRPSAKYILKIVLDFYAFQHTQLLTFSLPHLSAEESNPHMLKTNNLMRSLKLLVPDGSKFTEKAPSSQRPSSE